MPVKPDVAQILDLLERFGAQEMHESTPADARRAYALLGGLEKGEAVGSVLDHELDGPHGPFNVRVYRPAGTDDDERLPALLWFHGGGWVIGDLDTTDAVCRVLCNRSGACVISVDYHLAPEHPYPAAVDDAVSAVRWTVDHADELHVDPEALGVGGDSAGGNLAAVTAQLLQATRRSPLRFQLLVYPATDLTMSHPSITENGEGFLLTKSTMAWFAQHYIGGRDAKNPRISPLFASSLAGLPPALVITAEYDPLRDEGEAYAHALQAADVPTELVRYDGQIHGFVGLFSSIADGDLALTLAADALRTALAN